MLDQTGAPGSGGDGGGEKGPPDLRGRRGLSPLWFPRLFSGSPAIAGRQAWPTGAAGALQRHPEPKDRWMTEGISEDMGPKKWGKQARGGRSFILNF